MFGDPHGRSSEVAVTAPDLELPAPGTRIPTLHAMVSTPPQIGSTDRWRSGQALRHMVERAALKRHPPRPTAPSACVGVWEGSHAMPERLLGRLEVERAKADLEVARGVFDWVTEPRLVDEAIYRLRAAEIRLDNLVFQLHGRRAGPRAAQSPHS